MRYLMLFALYWLVGCSEALPPLPMLRLPPAGLAQELQLNQRLTVAPRDGGSPQVLDGLLEVDAGELRLAAFALGQRVLTLSWDGQHLNSSRHPWLPAVVQADPVLRDVQLVYWPVEHINAALPSGWQLVSHARQRELQYQGRTQLQISYGGDGPPWRQTVQVDNLREGYVLTLETAAEAAR